MKKVITYGTFDLFHIGHLELLKRAKELGDYLVVAVSTDEFNWKGKNKRCVVPYAERAAIVSAISYVDEVISEQNWDQKQNDIRKHGIDVFVIGDDWKGEFDSLAEFCEVCYLPRTSGISTTELVEWIYLKKEAEKNEHANK